MTSLTNAEKVISLSMRSLIIYIAFLTTMLISCNYHSNQEYTTRIDSLSSQLEKAVEGYSVIDSATIAEIRENVNSNCNSIDFEVDSNFNKLIIPYSQISKSIKQILKMDFHIKKEIQNSRAQISNLLHDVKNNHIDTTLLIKYIEEEKKAVNIIINRMKFNRLRVISETKRYDSLNPLIVERINKNN
ncbi:MAG TPA: hypothetical protein QF480_01090 [Bacteroidales bacterium]|nr:hypothetical protein [Bacteroidales bacterium]